MIEATGYGNATDFAARLQAAKGERQRGDQPFFLPLLAEIAYGFARDRYDFGDTSGNRNYNGNYQIGEVGVLWRIYESSEGRALKNVSLSFGYRAQNLTTKGVPSATFALTPTPVVIDVQHKDLSTTTDGFVVGIVGSF